MRTNWIRKLISGGTPKAPRSSSWEDEVLASDSRNGYERQRAVEALIRSGQDAALAVLLVRVNDWVPAVRIAALAGLEPFYSSDRISAWANALEQVVALDRAARVDHAPLRDRIRDFLATPDHVRALRDAVPAPSANVTRYLFSLELAIPMSDVERYVQLRNAVVGNDIITAISAIDAISILSVDRRVALASAACHSIFSTIRCAGLRATIALDPPALASLLRAMCGDASISARAIALSGLRTEEDRRQVALTMRARLGAAGGPRVHSVALDMLCALQVEDARELCTQARASSSSLIRSTAMSRLFKIVTSAERDALVLAALQDDSARVRKIGSAQVAKGARAPDVELLLPLMETHPNSFGMLARVMCHSSPWDRGYFLLTCLARLQGNAVAVAAVHAELHNWERDFARCFMPPNATQALQIDDLWMRMQDLLPAHLRARLASYLQAFHILSVPPGSGTGLR